MENTTKQVIENTLDLQREFFSSHKTRDVNFRLASLRKFKSALLRNEQRIAEALWADLHKSYEEAYYTETSIVQQELNEHIRHVKKWAGTKRVKTPLHLLPSRSRIYYEPLGVALIMAPWNYPFQLLLNPLIGAISSGCCAILKPSPYTPHIALVMEEIIREIFDPAYISVVQGNRDVNQLLLEQRFDMIFFTGSPSLGKTVMKAASQFLTPVVLELGGKSPCIVDEGANISVAAKRIAWGKFINAGQTCIAPDYLYVHQSVKEELIGKIIAATEEMYGKDPSQSKYYPRIVNSQAMERLQKLIGHGNIRYGGNTLPDEKYFSPTIVDDVRPDFPVMQEEIFGPVLPVMEFTDISQVTDYVNSHEKPLAFYYFGKQKQGRDILQKTSSGGGCINDTLLHIGNHYLPFGGVGNSGMQKYHGKLSFQIFSNAKSFVMTTTIIDLVFRYPPFRFFKLVKKII